jgi:hypothetical protein
MLRTILSVTCLLFFTMVSWLGAQPEQTAPSALPVQPRKLVDCPTAGQLPRGSFDVDLRLFPGGGALCGISVGLSERFLLGVSYGGQRIISDEKVEWFPHPGVSVRYRVIEENIALPALAVGFDSQGYGAYLESDTLSRYEVKSKGIYWVASKNYRVLGTAMGLHLGANYSLEDDDGDDDPTVFLGLDKSFNDEFSVIIEYDFAFNDNQKLPNFGKGNGYLDLGLRWSFGDRLTMEFDFMNLAENRKDIDYLSRQVRIVYLEYF